MNFSKFILRYKSIKWNKNNNYILSDMPLLKKSKIRFNGKGNILYCEKGVVLNKSNIVFNGDNSLIYLSKNINPYELDILIHNNSFINFGKNVYINRTLKIILSEEKNLFIGDDCLFSINVVIRNADPHLIYDATTKQRINPTESIYIGDHVWIGENVYLLKGTQISSGSIVGANSVLPNKKISSNTIWAANSAKKIKDNIFWTGGCVHKWESETTNNNLCKNIDDYIYNYDQNSSLSFNCIENELNSIKLAKDKLEKLKLLNKNNNKNRFFQKFD